MCQGFSRNGGHRDGSRPHPRAPELIAKAEALVREYGAQCFWFWRPDAAVRTREDVQLVVKELRRSGGRKAWLAAQELKQCL